MDKSDTPRTEQMIDSCGDYEKAYHYKGRFANFARGLEREVTALTAQLAEALQDAEVGRKWRENSSLEEWFPFTAQELAKARRDAEKMRKRHESSHAEVLRLADELRKRDPTWGSPMRLNNAAIQESKK